MIPLIILDDSIPNYLIKKDNFTNIRLFDNYKETSHATLLANSIFHPKLGVNNNFTTYWIQVYNYNKIDLETFYDSLDLIYSSFNTGVISIPLGYEISNLNENDYNIHLKIDKLLDKISEKFLIVAPIIQDKILFPSNKKYVIKIQDKLNDNKYFNNQTIWKTEIKKCFAFYDENRFIKDIGESYYTIYLSWWIINYFNCENTNKNDLFLKINNNEPDKLLPLCFI